LFFQTLVSLLIVAEERIAVMQSTRCNIENIYWWS